DRSVQPRPHPDRGRVPGTPPRHVRRAGAVQPGAPETGAHPGDPAEDDQQPQVDLPAATRLPHGAAHPAAPALNRPGPSGGEPRPQQVRMAREVAAALASGRHLLIEAGTGIGKSIGYLLPAILWATRAGPAPPEERRVVISTHTRALQEQLARKDLPLLQRALEPAGVTFRYALLMGSENYLCVQRLEELRLTRGDLLDGGTARTAEALARHARAAVSGLRSEMPFSVPDPLWARVRRDRDVCLGARGPFWEDCLYRRDLA